MSNEYRWWLNPYVSSAERMKEVIMGTDYTARKGDRVRVTLPPVEGVVYNVTHDNGIELRDDDGVFHFFRGDRPRTVTKIDPPEPALGSVVVGKASNDNNIRAFQRVPGWGWQEPGKVGVYSWGYVHAATRRDQQITPPDNSGVIDG